MAKLKDGTRIYGNANVNATLTTLDLVVTGNITVQGNSTTVDTTVTQIEDPVITLGGGAGGINATNDGKERGLVLKYNDGTAKDGFMGWDHSNAEFAFADTTSFDSANNKVSITTYGNIRGNVFAGNGSGLTALVGANVTGTVAYANFSSYAGIVTASNQPNIRSLGTLTGLTVGNSTANTSFGNGTITASGNISAGNISTSGELTVTGNSNVTGNIYVTGTIHGGISGTIVAPGLDTYVLFNDGGSVGGTAGLEFDKTSNTLTIGSSYINGDSGDSYFIGNVVLNGTAIVDDNSQGIDVYSANFSRLNYSDNAYVTTNSTGVHLQAGAYNADLYTGNGQFAVTNAFSAAGANFTVNNDGNVSAKAGAFTKVTDSALTSGQLVIPTTGGELTGYSDLTYTSGQFNTPNVKVTGVANVTGNVIGANLVTGGVANVTGNVIAGNLTTGGVANVTGNVIGGNLVTGGVANVTGNVIAGNVTTAGLVIGANVTANAMLTTKDFTINGNIIGDLIPNANVTQNLGNSTHLWKDLYLSGTSIYLGAQTISSNATALTTTADLSGGNVFATGNVVANIIVANSYITGTLSVASNAQPNITSLGTLTSLAVTGNITGGNVYANSGTIGASLLTGTLTTAAQPNVTSLGTLSSLTVTGNVDVGDHVNTNYVSAKSGHDITISANGTNKNVVLAPTGTGTVDVSGAVITGVGEPTLDNHAATKYYVDHVAQSLHVHAPVQVASKTNLSGYSANVITLGTALSTLDGYSVQSGDRILVKDQTTKAENGIYTIDVTLKILTRADDANVAADLAGGDFVFVVNGNTQGDTGWVQTEVVVTLGTSDIKFNQFSGAGSYSGNENKGIHFNGSVVETKVDDSTITWDGSSGNLKVKDSLTLVTPNIGAATGTSLNLGSGLITANGSSLTSINGSNVSEVALSTHVTASAQANITSVGTLNYLNVSTSGGGNGYVNATQVNTDHLYKADGTTVWDFAAAAGSSGYVQYHGSGTDLDASSNFTFDAGSQTLTVTNITANGAGLSHLTGSNVVGAVGLATYATTANAVAGANVSGAVAYATTANSVAGGNVSGTVGSASVAYSVDGGNVSGAVNLATYATTANAVAGANVSGAVAYATTANSVAGGNVTGTVSSATTAGTVTTAAQPNITSVGTLTSLTVSGATNLGAVGNVTITGGTSGQYLQTDGSGSLSWHTISTSTLSNGTSNVTVLNNGNVLISSAGNANIVVVTGTGANITGILDVSGNITSANIHTGAITANAGTGTNSSDTGTVIVTGGIGASGNIYTGKAVGFANNNGGTASAAYIQYNASANSLDFIFN